MIITILRILCFWLVMNGYFMMMKNKTKIKQEFIMPITFSLLIILLFLASLLNILYLVSILIIIGGIWSYAYLDKNHLLNKKFFQEYFNYKTCLLIIVIFIFTLICLNLHLTGYDDFSHWALSVKNLFLYNSLGTFEYNVDTFTAYPPGSSLFIYFFGLMAGKTESMMLVGQFYLGISFLSSIMILFDNRKKLLSSIFFFLVTIFLLVVNVPLNSLMVDSLLGYISLFSLLVAYTYRDDLDSCFLYLLVTSLLLYLVKNSGLYFVALNILIILLIGKKTNNVKKSFKYLISLLLVVLMVFALWQCHLKMVYPSNTGVNSKHSLSIYNLGGNLIVKGPSKIIEIGKLYLKVFIDFGNPIVRYILGINIFISLLAIIFRKYRRNIFKALLFIDFIYLSYYLCLGFMYIFSMPYKEALYLACYNRYMYTIIISIFAIILIIIYQLINNSKYSKYLVLLLSILLIYLISTGHYQILALKDDYETSDYKRVVEIEKSISISQYHNQVKNFYLNNNGYVCTFYTYALRYVYMDSQINAYCAEVDNNTFISGDILIVPDDTYNPFSYISKNDFLQVDDYTYLKK